MNTNIEYSDPIASLPLLKDKTNPTQEDMFLVEKYFEKNKNIFSLISSSFNTVIFLVVLFVVLQHVYIDTLLEKYIPITKTSSVYKMGGKCVLFGILCFVILNMEYIRK